jgi:formate dehydrogenase subunit delta
LEGVASHLRNFWEARMRREIVDYVARGGDALSPLVREAVSIIATESVPDSEDVGEG